MHRAVVEAGQLFEWRTSTGDQPLSTTVRWADHVWRLLGGSDVWLQDQDMLWDKIFSIKSAAPQAREV